MRVVRRGTERRGRLAAAIAIVVSACSSAPSAPTPAATIRIGTNGVAQTEVRIKAWDYVTFKNDDVRPHTIVSDPVDIHNQCPPLNRVGLLQPGESRDSGPLDPKRTCGFHDHTDPADASMKGRIVVE